MIALSKLKNKEMVFSKSAEALQGPVPLAAICHSYLYLDIIFGTQAVQTCC